MEGEQGMSKEWLDIDRKIGEWLDANGLASFADCPEVNRTMIYKGDLHENAERQHDHYVALNEIGCIDFDDVTEIGAGVGQFARRFIMSARAAQQPLEYRIYDLPNARRIQGLICQDMNIDWMQHPKHMVGGLIVSLFALSEMEFGERDAVLDAIGWGNAMFFAYQKKYADFDNDWWFTELGKRLGRPFTMSPTGDGHWYMYVEEE